ncbi:cyclic nucleotide-binding domain-containing protein [Crocosphaera sp. Alani8]|uniref:cyclic nucleotide-binding domain-containing protein n=1 Tax=Crocosphaera sp. Alani8 TaxID=3038952 RepID=UPI00313C9C2A
MRNLQTFLNNIINILESIKFPVGKNEITLIYLLQVIAYLIIILVLASYFNRILRQKILKKIISEFGIRYVFASIISYGLGAFCFIIILQITGFNVSTLAFLGGGVGIGIGLGLQGITKNLVSGLSVLLERKIKIGHFIKFKDVEGYVTEISTRSATVKLENGSSVIIPNRNLIESELTNYHYKTDHARLSLFIRVDYNSDLLLVTETLLICAYSETNILKIPPPQAIFKGFGDSCLDFELWIWINSDNMGIRFEVLSSLYFSIEYHLRERNIRIPLAQRELWLRNFNRTNETFSFSTTQQDLIPSTNSDRIENNYQSENISTSSTLFSITKLLAKVEYFKTLNDLQIRKLIEIGTLKEIKKSEILFKENDPGDAFYIILSGSVEIFTETLKKTLAVLQKGDFFGELALMLGIPRTATVKAIQDTVLFSINNKQFDQLLKNYPELCERIVEELGKNEDELEKRREELREKGLLKPEEQDSNIILWVRQRLQSLLSS